jgi:hypothetical protein
LCSAFYEQRRGLTEESISARSPGPRFPEDRRRWTVYASARLRKPPTDEINAASSGESYEVASPGRGRSPDAVLK